jgi:4-carboxymuconolactone decarboxylase
VSEPRLAPIPVAEWDDELRGIVGGQPLNIFATLAHHPKLAKRWLVFGTHVLAKNSLAPRDRELLILRIGWNCRSPYEWGQHVAIGRTTGISDDEIERITLGPDAPGWSPPDATLLRAADELFDDQSVTDATWAELAANYNEQQLLDIVFTIGQYMLVSMMLNTFRVERDDGVTDAPVPARD